MPRTTIQSLKQCGTTAVLILLCTTLSCKKETSTDAAKFAGTWTGLSTCTSDSATVSVIITAGSGNNITFTNNIATATYPALKDVTVKAVASGDQLTFPTQSFNDNSGHSITISGSGSLSGGTLTLYQEYTGYLSTACSFSGRK
ncbi:MAG: hypothetical protein H7257_13795 [Taibaiella sp.]|nr:hypothetical protein [Taibaiella sp.]